MTNLLIIEPDKNTPNERKYKPTTEHNKPPIDQTPHPQPLLVTANKGRSFPEPPTPPTVVHFGVKINQQLRVQISHRVTKSPPYHTHEWMDLLCNEMIVKSIIRLTQSSKNGLCKSWEVAWIPCHDGMDRAPTINFLTITIRTKDPLAEYLGLSWMNGGVHLEK